MKKYIATLIALVVFNQVFSLTPSIPQNIYYIVMGLGLIYILIYTKKLSFNPLIVWLLFAAIISIALNSIPSYFRAPLRLVTFTVIVALIGPLLSSTTATHFKLVIFKTLNYLIFLFAALSLLVRFGLPVPQTRGYSGFFNHSMMLGPMAAVALFIGFLRIYQMKIVRVKKNKRRILYLAIVSIFLSLLLASSRSAIAGAVAGLVFFFFNLHKNRIGNFLSIFFAVIILGTITFPAWSDYTMGIQKKQAVSSRAGDMASSRRSYWDARLEEFAGSPVVGIGFATLDSQKRGSNVRKETGGIEPGTSWLTILSMVGVLGFIPVFLLFVRNLFFLYRDKKDVLSSSFLGGLLVFFITHMFAEGYIFASGGFLFFYVWLLLGVIEAYRKNPALKII